MLELSEIQGTVTSAAPVALLKEEGTKRESFSFCSSRQVLGLTHKFPSESPTECQRSPGPEDAEAEHPPRHQTGNAAEHAAQAGAPDCP